MHKNISKIQSKFFNHMTIKNAKLVIWDLDETFWKGTLSEGGVLPIPQNIDIVKSLVRRGIMNSIVSKNDHDKVENVLKEWGIYDYFIFPRISWQPKGEVVKDLLKEMKLRAENTLFVDDNSSNLAEVAFYNNGITCILPDKLPDLLKHPAFQGKDDFGLSRLKQYRIMEERSIAETKYSSNEDFLRASHIKISICCDCLSEEDRIYELMQRTNQLNYTKIRSSKKEFHDILLDEDFETRYIRVMDDFGDYGIVGFYALKGRQLKHFFFSCRTIGFGIENFLYKLLNYPSINIVDDVITDLSQHVVVDWIELINIPKQQQDDMVKKDTKFKSLIVSGCDLQQALIYLQSKIEIDTEFATVIEGNEIRTSDTCSLVNILKLDDKTKKKLADEFPFIDYEITFGSKIYSGEYNLIILSLVDDYIRGMYRHKRDNYYIGYGAYFLKEEIYSKFPFANFDFLENNFDFEGKENLILFEDNIRFIVQHIPSSTQILLINGTDLDVSEWIGRDRVVRNIEMNAVVDKVVKDYSNVSLLDVRKIVTSKELLSKRDNRHYTRQVYYEIAKFIVDKYNTLTSSQTTSLKNPYFVDFEKDSWNKLKYFLKKCGIRNPLKIFKRQKNFMLFLWYNKQLSKIDFFNYENLIKFPNIELDEPFSNNISYGIYNKVQELLKNNIDLNKDYIDQELITCDTAPQLLSVLKNKPIRIIYTFSWKRKKTIENILKKAGYSNKVVSVSTLFFSVPNFYDKKHLKTIKDKIGKTLLVFPSELSQSEELIDEIERIKYNFKTILVCLNYNDILYGNYTSFSEKGYKLVCIGHRFDNSSFSRLRDLLDLSDIVMSDGISNYIEYSICLNKPYYYFKHNKLSNDKDDEKIAKVFNKLTFDISAEQKDFVSRYWGCEFHDKQ